MKRTQEELIFVVLADQYKKKIDKHIAKTVKSLGYDNEDSIAKYLVQGNAFYDECKNISLWIGEVWATSNKIQDDVKNGLREIPANIIECLPEYK